MARGALGVVVGTVLEDVRSYKELQGKSEQQQTYWSLQGCSVLNLMYKYNAIYQSSPMIKENYTEANNSSRGFSAKYTSRRFLNISVVEQSITLDGRPFHTLTT